MAPVVRVRWCIGYPPSAIVLLNSIEAENHKELSLYIEEKATEQHSLFVRDLLVMNFIRDLRDEEKITEQRSPIDKDLFVMDYINLFRDKAGEVFIRKIQKKQRKKQNKAKKKSQAPTSATLPRSPRSTPLTIIACRCRDCNPGSPSHHRHDIQHYARQCAFNRSKGRWREFRADDDIENNDSDMYNTFCTFAVRNDEEYNNAER